MFSSLARKDPRGTGLAAVNRPWAVHIDEVDRSLDLSKYWQNLIASGGPVLAG